MREVEREAVTWAFVFRVRWREVIREVTVTSRRDTRVRRNVRSRSALTSDNVIRDPKP